MSSTKDSKGQALVLVLLSLAVVLTLVLFILARSVTDISISSKNEESVRAFSAAEAGVEKALIIGTTTGSFNSNTASYTANVTSAAAGAKTFVYPIELNSGDAMTLWFVSHDEDGNLVCDSNNPCFSGNTIRVCWGKSGTPSSSSTTPALELSFYYLGTSGDYSTTKIARAVYDPYSSRALSGYGSDLANNFSSPDSGTCDIDGSSFQFQKTLTLTDFGINTATLQFMKARIFYNSDTSQSIGFDVDFSGNTTFPSQGITIDSTGVAGSSNRRLNVFQSWPELPTVFDYSIYSSSGLTK